MADDSEIVQALKSRPEEGARLLVRSYGRRLYAVARQLSRNNTDAEDLVARTLSRVVRGIGSFYEVERGRMAMVGDKGDNVWTPDPKGPHLRMVDKWQRQKVAALVDDLMAAPPAVPRPGTTGH